MNEQEQEFARKIFSNFSGFSPEKFPELRTLLRSSVVLSGDILLAERAPDGGVRMMVGDFTGHGVTAALGSILVTEVFQQLAREGASMPRIIEEVNERLYRKLPTGLFCAAAFLSLEHHQHRQRVAIWNCGLPPVLLASQQRGGIFQRVASTALPLGLVGRGRLKIEPTILFPQQGDHCYLYTDGFTEAEDEQGERIGQQRLEEMVEAISGYDNGGQPFDVPRYLARFVDYFTQGVGQQDDITVVELSIFPREALPQAVQGRVSPSRSSCRAVPKQQHWRVEMVFNSSELQEDEDNVPFFINLVGQRLARRKALSDQQRQELYLLLSEAWGNALDHGLLGLDSAQRETPEGFGRYYEEREQRLAALVEGEVVLQCSYLSGEEGGMLLFSLSDSGDGFDYHKVLERLEQGREVARQTTHGRGLTIIDRLCQWISFEAGGRTLKMAYKLQHGEGATVVSKNSEEQPGAHFFK